MTTPSHWKVVESFAVRGEWHVEAMNENGRFETVQIFRGPDARMRAIDWARNASTSQCFGEFDEIKPQPYRVVS